MSSIPKKENPRQVTDVYIIIHRSGKSVSTFSEIFCFLQAVLQFPGPVSDLVESRDKQLLYVACRSGVYCVSLPFLLSRYEPCLHIGCQQHSQ